MIQGATVTTGRALAMAQSKRDATPALVSALLFLLPLSKLGCTASASG
jgi:hypothetical protein